MKKKFIIPLALICLGISCTAISFIICCKVKGINTVNFTTTNKPQASDLKESEVKSIVEESFTKKLKDSKIFFSSEKYNCVYSMYEVGFKYNIDEITNKVIKKSKEKKILNNKDKITKMINSDKEFDIKPTIDKKSFDNFVPKISEHINKAIVRPSVSFSNNKVNISGGKDGYSLDTDKLLQNIDTSCNNKNTGENVNVQIPIDTLSCEVSQDIQDKMTVLGTFSTKVPQVNSGRTNNIKLFLSKFNGFFLLPNETFSCDKTAGRREVADGYTAAPSFVENKVVNYVAGGICQGVSTLYNAVLYADLTVVERAPHSLPVTYVSLGRDATIASGSIDFKFKNNKKYPIIIQTFVTNQGDVTANIWGVNEEPQKKIELTVEQLGPKHTKTYKHVYMNNKLVKTELISNDTYN